MPIPEEKIAKLPGWAQNEIKRLRANLESMERKLAIVDAGESDVEIVDYEPDKPRDGHIGLPPGSTIRFWINRARRLYLDVQVKRTDGSVTLNTDMAMRISPQSCNTVHIFPTERP